MPPFVKQKGIRHIFVSDALNYLCNCVKMCPEILCYITKPCTLGNHWLVSPERQLVILPSLVRSAITDLVSLFFFAKEMTEYRIVFSYRSH